MKSLSTLLSTSSSRELPPDSRKRPLHQLDSSSFIVSKDLKTQIETWGALVETRIHLESSLSLGHRFPSGLAAGLFREDAQVAQEAEAAAGEVRQVLAKLLGLQERMAKQCDFPKLEGKAREGDCLCWWGE